MPHSLFAVVLATALFALCTLQSRAENASVPFSSAWRQTDTLHTLVSTLEDWLDTRAEWPRSKRPPQIRFVSQWQAAARQGSTANFQRGRFRGLYDPDRFEILLVRPWDRRNAEDVSVLLHELVHHRQASHHWYCLAAQELPAYRLQEAWLSEQGLSADVNWIAVVLDAGCTPRDIHPD